MKKEELKQQVVEMQTQAVKDFEYAIQQQRAAIDLDEDGTIDLEDLSHQGENDTKMRGLIEQLNRAKVALDRIQRLNIEEKKTVELGSLVITNSKIFYISIPIGRVKFDGKVILGIATDAPIYESMRGKSKGDKFEWGRNKYVIKEII